MSSEDEVAAELYGLPLEEFTAARNDRAKKARQAGDRALAGAIGKLAKPTMLGWLANRLVRERPEELRALLDLGESLREATAALDREQLRELSHQQHRVVYALVQQARSLAGHPVSEDTARGLADTLHAALADPGAATALAQGRLTGGLSQSGFPGATPPPEPAGPAGRKPTPEEQRAAAERAEREARTEADHAGTERDKAQAALDQAGRAVQRAQQRAEDLRQQLDEATRTHTDAERELREARTTAQRADRAARHAQQRLADATERRHRLAG